MELERARCSIRVESSATYLVWLFLIWLSSALVFLELQAVKFSVALLAIYASLATLLERVAPRASLEGELDMSDDVVLSGETFTLTATLKSWLVHLVVSPRVELMSDNGVSLVGVRCEKLRGMLRLRATGVARVGTHELLGLRVKARIATLATSVEICVEKRTEIRVMPRLGEEVVEVSGGLPYDIGLSRLGKPGPGTQFYATREYRPGDELRHVDWKASLRTGRLVTKLFEKEVYRSVLVVLPVSCDYLRGAALDHLATEVLKLVSQLVKRGVEVGAATVGALVPSGGLFVKVRSATDLAVLAECFSRISWSTSPERCHLTYRTALWQSVKLLSEVVTSRSLVVYVGEPESDVDVLASKMVSGIVRSLKHEPVFAVVSPQVMRLVRGEASPEDLIHIFRRSGGYLRELSATARVLLFHGDELIRFLARSIY